MASTTTNVDYYAAGFDSAGRRVCSLICDFNPNSSKNADKITALLNKVKATSDDVDVAEIITSDYFNEYLNGKVRDLTENRLTISCPNRRQKRRKPQKEPHWKLNITAISRICLPRCRQHCWQAMILRHQVLSRTIRI